MRGEAAALAPGDKLGCFRVEGRVGQGASGAVYAAEDERTGEVVALKCLADGAQWPQLKREFRVASALQHPNLVRLRELHASARGPYFTMECVRGTNIVAHLLRVDDLGERARQARELFGQLALGLQHLHAAAFAHRDIKPDNVLVGEEGRVVLVDFGLAQRLAKPAPVGFSGTYVYAAPERLHGEAASPKSDWFSFGVVLFEALTGELPLGPDAQTNIVGWLERRRVSVRERVTGSAASFVPLLEGVLQPYPAQRWSGEQVLEALGVPRRAMKARRLRGRDSATDWLQRRLQRPNHPIAVVGPPGVGKSRLVHEVLDELEGQRLVLRGRCHPRESLPFNALDGVVSEILTRAERDAPEHAAVLASVFARGDVVGGRDVSLEAIADALSQALRAVARGRLVVLFFDDVQWADRDSVALLWTLRERGWPGHVVVAARGTAESIPEPLRPPQAELVWPLTVLDFDASRSLLRELAPELGDPQVTSLVAFARGNPLLLEQAAAWAAKAWAARAWAASGARGRPERLGELVVELSSHDDEQLRLLEALAVHGHALDSDVLLARSRGSLAAAYDLLDAGLVEFQRRGSEYRVSVGHQEISDALLAELSAGELRRHHAELAEAFAEARPEAAGALFRHWLGAGERSKAREPALRLARELHRSMALHGAVERYRWLIEHEPDQERKHALRCDLADALSRAGEGAQAADVYQTLAQHTHDPHSRRRFTRLAAEQLLRSGEVARGQALLRECIRDSSLTLPQGTAARLATLLYRRLRISAAPLWRTSTSKNAASAISDAQDDIELAWSVGLGLNHVDLFGSAMAQAQFTDLALERGTQEQAARARAVEYSFAMLAGAPGAERRGAQLRRAMEQHPAPPGSYARAMTDLSWAAGDYFRGHLGGTDERLERARRGFERQLGAKSWELANCGMYAAWVALEQNDLSRVVKLVPELLRMSTSRGDILYRLCFVGGFCATAWLIQDKPCELEALLEELPRPEGEFQIPHFLQLIARCRLDLYRGRPWLAWARVQSAWPGIRRSGVLLTRWMRLVLGLLGTQVAIAASGEPGTKRFVQTWLPRLARMRHPMAKPWSRALRVASTGTGAEQLVACEQELSSRGFDLLAASIACYRGESVPAWKGVVRSPAAFSRAVGMPVRG